MDQLQQKRSELLSDLDSIERTIYELEDQYLEDTISYGNVVKGWEGYASLKNIKGVFSGGYGGSSISGFGGTMRTGGSKRITYKDRIFSNSSATSPSSISSNAVEDGMDDEMGLLSGDMGALGGTGRRSNRGINYAAAHTTTSKMDDMY